MRVAVQVLVGTVQSVVTLPWFLLRSRSQLARFDEHSRHVVVGEPGPGGRPGERAEDEDATVARAREVLDTWEWLD